MIAKTPDLDSAEVETGPFKPSIILSHLNADATFLISYLPVQPSSSTAPTSKPFSILIDPWLTGISRLIHPYFLTQSHTITPSITRVSQLPHKPDLVLISQDNEDHCHEETLRGLATCGEAGEKDTPVWAVAGAGGRVKSWEIKGLVVGELKPWKAKQKQENVVALEIPTEGMSNKDTNNSGIVLEQVKAHVEIAYLPAIYLWELPSLHTALGIRFITTYTYRSEQDASQKIYTHTHQTIHTPHGVTRSVLFPYLRSQSNVTNPEGNSTPRSLPKIDLLLHPFTVATTNPLFGGKVILGLPNVLDLLRPSEGKSLGGVEIGIFVSAHDEELELSGWASGITRHERRTREQVEKEVEKVAGEGRVKVWELGNGEAKECVF